MTIVPAALASLLSLAADPAPGRAAAGRGTVVLKAARLFDGTGGDVVRPGVVVVRDDRIIAAGAAGKVEIPADARTIDLGDATLLPGFIDAHTHLIGRPLGDPMADNAVVRDYAGYAMILGVVHARETLMAGFTTVRNVGAARFDDLALRKAIDEGVVPGPRMRCSAYAIGMTGGHADTNGFRPGLLDESLKEGIADGADAARAAVRYQCKQGADVIKMMATGGVLSEGDAVGETQYTLGEMRAVVEEANRLGRKVAAHAHGAEGIKLAVRAGVASIEHGSFLDDEGARMMAASGTYLVPTLSAGERVERAAREGILKGLRAEKARAAAKGMRDAIRRAVAHKVPIAFGTDAGVVPHGTNAHEFELLVSWGGLSPKDAILAGTRDGAKLLGWDDRLGTLEKGKLADVVAVPGDPLEDVKALGRPSFVMRNGVIYRGDRPGPGDRR